MAPECWFDSTPEDRERTQLIQQAMCKLPEIYRQVITLKTWGGLTLAEIAEALEIPANTAASRYRYGLEELRKTVSASYEDRGGQKVVTIIEIQTQR